MAMLVYESHLLSICYNMILVAMYILSSFSSIAIFMTLCMQICKFSDNSAVKGLIYVKVKCKNHINVTFM